MHVHACGGWGVGRVGDLGVRSVYLLDHISPDDSLLVCLCHQLRPAGIVPQVDPIGFEGNLYTA